MTCFLRKIDSGGEVGESRRRTAVLAAASSLILTTASDMEINLPHNTRSRGHALYVPHHLNSEAELNHSVVFLPRSDQISAVELPRRQQRDCAASAAPATINVVE